MTNNRPLSSLVFSLSCGLERPLSLCRSSCLEEICKSFFLLQTLKKEYKLTRLYSSFFQSVCIIGYTLFPLVIAALLSALGLPMIVRIPVYLVLIAWSLAAGVSILGGSGVLRNRVGIAVYPLLVFYISIGCLCFIS